MAILDSKGRLFGKLSLLDIGAALTILMVVFGIFFYPGSGGSVAQLNARFQDVEVDVMARGLTVLNPQAFLENLSDTGSTNIVVRNQPYGESVEIKAVESLPRSVAVPQPDGTVKSYPDPRPELNYTVDMLITLGGKAEVINGRPILGVPVKVGTPIEIDGDDFNFRVSTVAVRVLDGETPTEATPAPEAESAE